MIYNQLRDKVKAFLAPYAQQGIAVGAEDVKAYFERLRGDERENAYNTGDDGHTNRNDERDDEG